jgi:hypothetical protein
MRWFVAIPMLAPFQCPILDNLLWLVQPVAVEAARLILGAGRLSALGSVGSGTAWTVGAETFGLACMLGAGLLTPPTGATEGLQPRGQPIAVAQNVAGQPTRLPESVGAPHAIRQENFAAPEPWVLALVPIWLAAEVFGSVDVGCLVDDVGPSKAADIHAYAIVQVAMPADCLACRSDWKSSEGRIARSPVG